MVVLGLVAWVSILVPVPVPWVPPPPTPSYARCTRRQVPAWLAKEDMDNVYGRCEAGSPYLPPPPAPPMGECWMGQA